MAKVESRFKPNISFLRAVALTVKNQRRLQSLSQEELSRRAGIHWRYLQEIEAGIKDETGDLLKNISLGLFYALANGFGISVTAFMTLVEETLKGN
jgi:transcriptional regulator with XRE-family HTH domain